MASHAPDVAELLFRACSSQHRVTYNLLKGNPEAALEHSEGSHNTGQIGSNGSVVWPLTQAEALKMRKLQWTPIMLSLERYH